eukprot:CAMPEP_0118941270 /NCGR_PEP_ID=MMETSP1169-20130426/33461_1 /TAXON_ID=36882 /ORGANISM="Pyramimonas obovata, Strain CCMP722" /LENGTH=311 /DNA_ID=CAMNT_0006885973 /DNA_START=74 /DNA_END=1006 /DNA_ORIENTATION=-
MEGTNLEPEWKKPLALPDLPAEDVLSAFLTYMHYDSEDIMIRRLNASGKSPVDLDLSANIKYVRKRNEDIRGTNESLKRVLEEEEQTLFYQDALKYRKEKEKRALRKNASPEDPKQEATRVCDILFDKYSNTALMPDKFPAKKGVPVLMGTIGFMRILRDSGLLDNRFGFVEANTWWESAAGKVYEEADKPFEKDWFIEKPTFAWIITKLAKYKYPKATSRDDATQCLVDMYLGPLSKLKVTPLSFDKMLGHNSMAHWEKHDDLLKKIFTHYATLNFLSAHMVCWTGVRERNNTLDMDAYTLLMNNFEVFP